MFLSGSALFDSFYVLTALTIWAHDISNFKLGITHLAYFVVCDRLMLTPCRCLQVCNPLEQTAIQTMHTLFL